MAALASSASRFKESLSFSILFKGTGYRPPNKIKVNKWIALGYQLAKENALSPALLLALLGNLKCSIENVIW